MSEICILCSETIEGEDIRFTLEKGFVLYTRKAEQGPLRPIVHNCKTPEFYEELKKKKRVGPLEVAFRKLLLDPNDQDALMTVKLWRAEELLRTAHGGGQAGIRAATTFLREYEGEPTTQRDLSTIDPKPKVIVHITEPGQWKPPAIYIPPAEDETEDVAYDTRDDEFDSHAEALEAEEPEQIRQKRSLAEPLYGPTIIIGPDGSNWGWKLSKEELAAKRRPINPYALRW